MRHETFAARVTFRLLGQSAKFARKVPPIWAGSDSRNGYSPSSSAPFRFKPELTTKHAGVRPSRTPKQATTILARAHACRLE